MYELKSRVRFSEVDAKGRLTYFHMLNYLQDCATMQSQDVGYGMDWLFENHCGWFLTNWEIVIDSLPQIGDSISVRTYPTSIKGFIGIRDFVISDDGGNICVKAHSSWVLMDTQKMIPARVSEEMIKAYSIDSPPTDEVWEKSRLKPLGNESLIKKSVVDEMKLDYNGHMNNAYYLQMGLLALPSDYNLKRVRIEYKHQAKIGTNICICSCETEGGYQVLMQDEEKNNLCIIRTT